MADILQMRGVDYERFVEKVGEVSAETMLVIATAVAAVVEYE